MAETFFPLNDLLRRKRQTILTVVGLALCVALPIYTVLFGDDVGLAIAGLNENRLTVGFSTIFSSLLIFSLLLAVIMGAVIVSSMTFLMTSQRVRDIGVMKASGCPNNLVFGYFMTELLIISFSSCFLGVVSGVLGELASVSILNFFGFPIAARQVNYTFILLVFVLSLVLILLFGLKPVMDATKIKPAEAISPSYRFGSSENMGLRALAESGLTFRIAFRSLVRRKSATIRLVLCLVSVFVLVTTTVAGGTIGDLTSRSWIERAVGKGVKMIAHEEMGSQYIDLLAKFYGGKSVQHFDYMNDSYLIPDDLLKELEDMDGIFCDERLVIEMHVREVPGEIFDLETATVSSVGDHRIGRSLIVGVRSEKVLNEWFLEGDFVGRGVGGEAVVGDTLAHTIFTAPLDQSVMFSDRVFDVTGVCFDPINNGNVTYVSLDDLKSSTGMQGCNIVLFRIGLDNNASRILEGINRAIERENAHFKLFSLDEVLDESLSFVGYIWSTVKLLPMLSVVAVSLCLTSYLSIAVADQRQELGILKALGMRRRAVRKIILGQSLIVLSSSLAVGVAIGVILTLLILVPEPVVTFSTLLEIIGWVLLSTLIISFSSLFLAEQAARRPLPELMSGP